MNMFYRARLLHTSDTNPTTNHRQHLVTTTVLRLAWSVNVMPTPVWCATVATMAMARPVEAAADLSCGLASLRMTYIHEHAANVHGNECVLSRTNFANWQGHSLHSHGDHGDCRTLAAEQPLMHCHADRLQLQATGCLHWHPQL